MRLFSILCALTMFPAWALAQGPEQPAEDAPPEPPSADEGAGQDAAGEPADPSPEAPAETESPEAASPETASPETASPDTAADAAASESDATTEDTEGAADSAPASTDAEAAAPQVDAATEEQAPEGTPPTEAQRAAWAEEEGGEAEEEEESDWDVQLHGEFRFRIDGMGDIPLHTESRTELPAELGQNWWATTWLRLTGEVSWRRQLRLVGQIDVADGVLFGEETQGVTAAARPRDGTTAFASAGVDPRWLYLEYLNPKFGMIRAGLQPSHWGLGLLANDGAHEPPFGDYRYGNQSIRLLFGSRPLGMDVPFNLVVAGDVVYRDPLASLTDGQVAFQAIVSAFYGDPTDDTIGGYVVRRTERRSPGDGAPNDELDIWAMDVFGRAQFDDPTGKGEIILAFEGLHIRGDTTYTRTVDRPTFDVRQFMWAFQAGRTSERFDVFFEMGYATGDSNTEDSVQRRATMHPDHRVGLILFPEVMAWNSARASTLAGDDTLVGRPPPGSDLLPTDGGVSGATYLFNWWTVRPLDWMKINVGWLWARSTADVVDPYRQRSQSRSVSYLGGNPENRSLGLELDASIMMHYDLPFGFRIQGGVEGGVLFPGDAFDDATGFGMDTVGLVRLRLAFLF